MNLTAIGATQKVSMSIVGNSGCACRAFRPGGVLVHMEP